MLRAAEGERVSCGQWSEAGRKESNQDFHGLCVSRQPLLATKGIAIALADGIGSSEAGQQAAQAAVGTFLADYYCTSEAWSAKKSAERVLAAVNAWLFAQTQAGQGRYDRDRGWVCTFSAIVVKARTAHLFHVGDARIWQLQGRALEQLTQDHRVHAGGGQSWLGRALGIAPHVEIDYRAMSLEPGDTFLLATDGVHEHVPQGFMVEAIARHASDLDAAARAIVQEALARGSEDNVTVQVLRIDALPQPQPDELQRLAAELPLPPALQPRMEFDGWRIERELHASSRSHVHLATDLATGATAVLKLPSTELAADAAWHERFLLEEWVARRVHSAHVLQAGAAERRRNFLYLALEHVEGRTLRQWMLDEPRPALDAVRGVIGQVARGLRALHRLEMVHHDLRPENVMLDRSGTAKLIDLGSVRVAGLDEMAHNDLARELGTPQYTAPELLLGEGPSPAGDLFSLAVIAYEMLAGQLPYGARVAQCRTREQQRTLRYRSLRELRPDVPPWVDEALRKALQPEPRRRYRDVDEFVFALHQPDPQLRPAYARPLIERDPVVFWKAVSLLLGLACMALLAVAAGH